MSRTTKEKWNAWKRESPYVTSPAVSATRPETRVSSLIHKNTRKWIRHSGQYHIILPILVSVYHLKKNFRKIRQEENNTMESSGCRQIRNWRRARRRRNLTVSCWDGPSLFWKRSGRCPFDRKLLVRTWMRLFFFFFFWQGAVSYQHIEGDGKTAGSRCFAPSGRRGL